jgi:hypothetical protein
MPKKYFLIFFDFFFENSCEIQKMILHLHQVRFRLGLG